MLVAAIDSKLDCLVERFTERFDELEHRQDVADHRYDDTEQHIERLLQWAQSHDESEHAPTDDDPFTDGRPTGNNPRGQPPLGQPTPSAEQAQTQQLNTSSAQPGGGQASTSTNSSNEPQSGFRNPTDEPYFWNNDVHKDIIDDCDRQDRINWERKLEALANLLALAESKRARTTYTGGTIHDISRPATTCGKHVTP